VRTFWEQFSLMLFLVIRLLRSCLVLLRKMRLTSGALCELYFNYCSLCDVASLEGCGCIRYLNLRDVASLEGCDCFIIF